MGTTGLETSFAAVYTDLVLPGVLPLALVVEKLNQGAALFDVDVPKVEVGRRADLTLVDLARSGPSARAATSRARRTTASPGDR
jgi:dihydroorotase